MSLVPYDSNSDSETEIEQVQNSKRKILLPPLSSYDVSEDFPTPQPPRRVQGKTNLLAILPPPKHAVRKAPSVFKPKIAEGGAERIRILLPDDDDDDEEEALRDRSLIKALTDPRQSPQPEVEHVNATCRKKNHISYLVQKAKESEQEMKNQWADSKFTRQQMRAKYGF